MADKYDIWAQKVMGGTKSFVSAMIEFKSCENIYNACHLSETVPSCLKKLLSEKINSFSIEDAQKVLDVCEANGWKAVSCTDPNYPSKLLEIEDYPAVLFCDGDVNLLNKIYSVVVVGTRNPSDSGRSVAYKAGLSLSSAGVCLVSGAAFGIDNCAHEGAVLGGSGTVAVLGCGLGADYVNKIPLSAERIRAHGLMITEMFPFEKPGRFSFPKRNRILSGLSNACLVIECGEKSGAIITAELALKQKRKLFCISADTLSYRGFEKLVDIGAVPINTAAEIFTGETEGLKKSRLSTALKSDGLEGRSFLIEGALTAQEYSAYHHSDKSYSRQKKQYADTIKTEAQSCHSDKTISNSSNPEISGLGSNEKQVLMCISEKPVVPDEIADKTGLDIISVTVALTTLEIEGLIKMNPGNKVTLK